MESCQNHSKGPGVTFKQLSKYAIFPIFFTRREFSAHFRPVLGEMKAESALTYGLNWKRGASTCEALNEGCFWLLLLSCVHNKESMDHKVTEYMIKTRMKMDRVMTSLTSLVIWHQ